MHQILRTMNRFYNGLPDRDNHIIHAIDCTDPVGEEEDIVVLSHNGGRTRHGNGGCPCLTPHGKFWLRRRARLLLAQERMNLQGMFKGQFVRAGTSDSTLIDLAGNAVCATVMSAAYIAYIAAVVD